MYGTNTAVKQEFSHRFRILNFLKGSPTSYNHLKSTASLSQKQWGLLSCMFELQVELTFATPDFAFQVL